MKKQYLIFTAKGKVGMAEEELPAPPAGHVQIRIKLSLISPGTELAFFERTHTSLRDTPDGDPCSCPGYSIVGIVEMVGSGVTALKPGDRVACPCDHANRVNVDAGTVTKIPEDVPDEQAVFFMIGSIALHGIRTAAPQFGETVLVLGLGAIGQISVRLLRLTPVREIIAADFYQFRLDHAGTGGAGCLLNPNIPDFEAVIQSNTGGRGCEVVIDASGSTKAVSTALRVAAKRGRVIMLGSPHGEAVLDLYTGLHKKEVSLIGCFQPNCPEVETSVAPWTQQRNRALILDYIRTGRLDLATLITHRASFRQAQSVYDALSREKDKSLVGVFDWGDSGSGNKVAEGKSGE
jgi:2-desacetyl-2-hydroxyethyl bacteriochlorophyllide A dehydrogenase